MTCQLCNQSCYLKPLSELFSIDKDSLPQSQLEQFIFTLSFSLELIIPVNELVNFNISVLKLMFLECKYFLTIFWVFFKID